MQYWTAPPYAGPETGKVRFDSGHLQTKFIYAAQVDVLGTQTSPSDTELHIKNSYTFLGNLLNLGLQLPVGEGCPGVYMKEKEDE